MTMLTNDFKKILEGVEALTSTKKMGGHIQTDRNTKAITEMHKVLDHYKSGLRTPIGLANYPGWVSENWQNRRE